MKAFKLFLIAMILTSLFVEATSVNRSYRQALRYYEKGELNKALEKVHLSLKQSKSKEAMWLKGHILVKMKSYTRAIAFLEYKLPHGNVPNAHLTALGDCYFELGNYERSLYYNDRFLLYPVGREFKR